MPLDPQAREFLDFSAGLPPLESLTVPQARERVKDMTARMGPGEAVSRVLDRTLPGPAGDIPVRIYYPAGKGPFAVQVFFHGGGWVLGSLDSTDFLCRALTNASGCAVVSVNYRHAPEHRFPAAVEDAYAATTWVGANAAEIGCDPARLGVSGASAGGNLAAVVTHMARDRGGPAIRFQVLQVPVTDHNFETASYRDNADDYGLTRAAMQWFWGHYLGPDGNGTDPRASPLRAADLKGLPPAMVVTAEFDPLLDEGAAYAQRLEAAGVPVTYLCCKGMLHMFLGPDAIPAMGQAMRRGLGVS